jgi:uncharacterized membrane protein
VRSIITRLHYNLLWTVFVCALLLGVLEIAGHALGRGIVADSPINFLRYALPAALLVLHCTWALGIKRGCCFILIAILAGFIAEVISIRYGIIFGGKYSYHTGEPRLLGVPLAVPLFWAIFIYGGYSLTTSLLCWSGSGKPSRLAGYASLLPALVVLDGCIVVAIDLLLDPLAVQAQLWSWPDGGAYFGVPIGNFAGWFAVVAVATGLFRVFEYAQPPRDANCDGRPHVMPALCYGVLCLILVSWAVRVRLAFLALVGPLVMGLVPAVGLIILSLFAASQRRRARARRP